MLHRPLNRANIAVNIILNVDLKSLNIRRRIHDLEMVLECIHRQQVQKLDVVRLMHSFPHLFSESDKQCTKLAGI
jgi:hypothetical protein